MSASVASESLLVLTFNLVSLLLLLFFCRVFYFGLPCDATTGKTVNLDSNAHWKYTYTPHSLNTFRRAFRYVGGMILVFFSVHGEWFAAVTLIVISWISNSFAIFSMFQPMLHQLNLRDSKEYTLAHIAHKLYAIYAVGFVFTGSNIRMRIWIGVAFFIAHLLRWHGVALLLFR